MAQAKLASTLVLCCAVFLLSTGVPKRCFSDEKSEAKRLFDEGKAFFVDKDYDAAIDSFQASLEIYPTYNGYYNLANCYRAVRRYAEALEVVGTMRETLGPSPKREMREKFLDFETAVMAIVGTLRLKVVPDGSTVVVDGREVGVSPIKEKLLLGPGYHEIVARKVGYEKKVEHVQIRSEQESDVSLELSEALAELYLTIDIAGALVTINKEPMGKTPLKDTIKLPPGNHTVTVSKPGYREVEQQVNIVPGAKTALSMSLEKLSMSQETQPEPMRSYRSERLSPLFWGMASGTLVSGVMGGVFWGLAFREQDNTERFDREYLRAANDDERVTYDEKRVEAKDKGEGYNGVAIGFSVATGLLAAGTVVVLIRDIRKPRSTQERPAVSMQPGGLTVRF